MFHYKNDIPDGKLTGNRTSFLNFCVSIRLKQTTISSVYLPCTWLKIISAAYWNLNLPHSTDRFNTARTYSSSLILKVKLLCSPSFNCSILRNLCISCSFFMESYFVCLFKGYQKSSKINMLGCAGKAPPPGSHEPCLFFFQAHWKQCTTRDNVYTKQTAVLDKHAVFTRRAKHISFQRAALIVTHFTGQQPAEQSVHMLAG